MTIYFSFFIYNVAYFFPHTLSAGENTFFQEIFNRTKKRILFFVVVLRGAEPITTRHMFIAACVSAWEIYISILVNTVIRTQSYREFFFLLPP